MAWNEIGKIGAIPPGGTTGQVLAKASEVDKDVGWVDQATAGTALHFRRDDITAAPADNEVLLDQDPYESSLDIFVDGLLLPMSAYSLADKTATLSSLSAGGEVFSIRYWSEEVAGPSSLAGAWAPELLFQNGEQGALYSLTPDFAGLYQDEAGTLPVTAVGQPVGRIEDRSPNGLHATQATDPSRPVLPVDGPLRLRTDFDDDVLTTTLPVDCEVWVNTPHGHYRAFGSAGLFHLPLNDCTHFLAIDRELSPPERDLIADYFGTPARWGCYLSANTTTSINARADAGQGDGVFHFVGDNGVAVTKTWPRGDSSTAIDLADDGLTAPMMIMPDIDYGPRYISFEVQGLAGSIPTLERATNLTSMRLNVNQLTGSIPPLSAAPSLGYVYLQSNQLTGDVPDMTDSNAMDAMRADSNPLTGHKGGGVDSLFVDMRLDNTALTQAAVDSILRAFDEAGYTGSGRLFLQGGTSEAPSSVGLAHAASLTGRGWNVQVNS